jgi:hypothetical protein
MVPGRLREAFLENPERLLALMLSTPAEQRGKSPSSITIDFTETEVHAKVPRPREIDPAPQLLATKPTIFAGILMHQLVIQRGLEFADSLVEQARRFSETAAKEQRFELSVVDGMPAPSLEADGFAFFRQLEAGPKNIENAWHMTVEALQFLEEEGLAFDPGFTPGLVVLAGLIPMQFSVRTPKGERIYREIKINAPMWSLDIGRGRRGETHFTEVDFTFRGILIVRKAITAMASQYLDSEEDMRRAKGERVLKRKGRPDFDAD